MPEARTPRQLGEDLTEPVAQALAATARVGSIVPMGPPKPVADQSFKFLVRSTEGDPVAVVLCSPAISPDLVDKAMRCAREAKEALGPGLGQAVLEPLGEGRLSVRSYAILPYCQPLSEKRIVGWLERRRLRPKVFDWLLGLTRQTMRDITTADKHARFIRPLGHLAELRGASDSLRLAATHGLERLDQGRWTPRHVLMHNDLWKGNILLGGEGGFVVIDWPGSVINGYAAYDLVRLAESFSLSDRALGEQARAHCRQLGCEPQDLSAHLAAGLGHLSMNLDHFPMDLFLPMAEACVRRVSSAVGSARGQVR